MLLDPGFELTLRPMKYPFFYEMYRNAIKNTWTVEEIDFSTDLADLDKLTDAEKHLIQRLIAFFATGDTIVANNLVLNLYQHINAPEARMYLSRQLYEEALHIQFYLTLLDTYLPDEKDRAEAFKAIETVPSIKKKESFVLSGLTQSMILKKLRPKRTRRSSYSTLFVLLLVLKVCSFLQLLLMFTSCAQKDCFMVLQLEQTGFSETKVAI